LVVYAALATLVARYEPGVDIPLNSAALAWVTALACTGAIAWMIRTGRRPRLRLHPLTWLLVALCLWIALSCALALVRDGWFAPVPEHHPLNYIPALLLYLLATQFLGEVAASLALAAAICIGLVIRARLLSPFGVWRQEDIASWIAMALPLGALCIARPNDWLTPLPPRFSRFRRPLAWGWVLAFTLIVLILLWELVGTQNRTGVIGLAAALLVLWLLSRQRLLILLCSTPLLVLAPFALRHSEFWRRFSDLWTGGPEKNSALARLELWRFAWRLFLEHPLAGIGPGNFESYLSAAYPGIDPKPPHNNVLAMLCETGLPGALLYAAFFLGALLLAVRILRLARPDWPAPAAHALTAALAAYLAIGLTITRQDLVMAYLFAGWTVALQNHLTGLYPLRNTRSP
jgi:O-antigen ligase